VVVLTNEPSSYYYAQRDVTSLFLCHTHTIEGARGGEGSKAPRPRTPTRKNNKQRIKSLANLILVERVKEILLLETPWGQ